MGQVVTSQNLGHWPTEVVAAVDVAVKVLLGVSVVAVVIDPTWGNLEGKAPVARALIYPLPALALVVVWPLWVRDRPFPWLADLLLTLTGFSDILGNRLDLYDEIAWFDDWIHFMNNGLVGAAILLLTTAATATFMTLIARSLAFTLTMSLAWELWEYLTFLTRHSEAATAYQDTLADLALGWLGAVSASVVLFAWRRHRRMRNEALRFN